MTHEFNNKVSGLPGVPGLPKSKVNNNCVFFVIDFFSGYKHFLMLLAHLGIFYGEWVRFHKISNLDLGWVKAMCGEFGEFTGIIGLKLKFLAGGTLLLNFCDNLT